MDPFAPVEPMEQVLSLQTYDSGATLSYVTCSACTYPPPSSPTAGCSTLGCTTVSCSPEINRSAQLQQQ